MNLDSTPFSKQWEKIGMGSHHGINLPLSALRTQKSCGIGEFLDLIPLIDWCKKVGFNLIQLLPLNDSADDPSPYFAISSCALNPLHISLRSLENHKHSPLLDELALFNETSRVQFHEVQSRKLSFLRGYCEEMGPAIVAEKGYQDFLKRHPWVENYALFKTLKDQLSKNHWRSWPSDLQSLDKQKRRELLLHHKQETEFYILLQYLAFKQLTQVKNYAKSNGILLMGDMPILISDDSCDVWENPNEFDTTLTAGAPPDYYNKEGQAWGFPLFRWEEMQKNNYGWWDRRLKAASQYYDIFRIDHVLGFFRIWAIPPGELAKEGHFIPSDPKTWLDHGRKLLKMIALHSPMLPIAEDLGVTFTGMRELMEQMGLCGTKVMRWERHWESDKHYIDPKEYNPLSLTTLSTHDSETLALWWSNFPEEAIPYAEKMHWNYTGKLSFEERIHFLRASHQSGSLFHVNLIGEYLALFPQLVWENPEDERINIPGKLLSTNWTYRLRPSVEELTMHQELANAVIEVLQNNI